MERDKIIITYDNGITQEFWVIDHEEEFLNLIKPSRIRLEELLSYTKSKQKKSSIEINTLKDVLSKYNFKWCTDKSPIYDSHKNQILSLPVQQGGATKVKTKLIKYV
jgi:hypothetical protein